MALDLSRGQSLATAVRVDRLAAEEFRQGVFEYWRGTGQLERGCRSVSSMDRKRLLADLAAMHVSGIHSAPAGNGSHSFRLDSRRIRGGTR
jgi:hypothetical protein